MTRAAPSWVIVPASVLDIVRALPRLPRDEPGHDDRALLRALIAEVTPRRAAL